MGLLFVCCSSEEDVELVVGAAGGGKNVLLLRGGCWWWCKLAMHCCVWGRGRRFLFAVVIILEEADRSECNGVYCWFMGGAMSSFGSFVERAVGVLSDDGEALLRFKLHLV